MSSASVTLSEQAREQARRIQQQVPTFAETLLAARWRLPTITADNPRAGRQVSGEGTYSYRREPAPGSPGIRVTYTYRPGEVVIVAVELLD